MAILAVPAAQAAEIRSVDIHEIPGSAVGSGNGTLALRMATYSGSEIDNSSGGFNGDNGNNTLSQGGGDTSFDESYVTTAGELQAYYTLNFGVTTTNEIELVVFLDLNETGGDVTSSQQPAINQIDTGGTTIAWLNPEPADNILVNSQGAGFADYAISTGIDPFSLDASDVLLFNFSMELLNNGAEELFLSGELSGTDVGLPPIPEPSTALLLASGLAALALGRRRRS
jgi:hypothetical protein